MQEKISHLTINMKASTINTLFQRIAKASPNLKLKLKQAGMDDKPEDFIKKTFVSSFYMTTGLVVSLFLVLAKLNVLKGILFIFVPFVFIVMFFYMIRLPDVKISKKEKEITKEIMFAGRFLIVELESGVPLYNAMVNLSKNYEVIGKYFKEITDKVDLGTSMEDALNEAVEFVPSEEFRKVLWQIINSLRTGSDVAKSLYSVMEQITKDQITEVNKYGKKLNPLAMFYMIVAVILPSLGITMLIILSSFIQFQLSLTVLLALAGLLGFVQFMFISIVKFSRPAIEF
ncbi:type II secretion system F family protein [Candidatus Woesearchaeota archaeon]|nr:type II secretion system F family protein [Candidatus Woesearchaeota archaeon]